MINLKSSRKTPSINVDCSPVTNVRIEHGSNEATTIRYPPVDGGIPVQQQYGACPNSAFVSVSPLAGDYQAHPQASPQAVSSYTAETAAHPLGRAADVSQFENENPEIAKLLRENAVLKLIIDIQHSNPIVLNKFIIADDATLVKLVALLCNASEVHIDADDVGTGCITKNTYRKVHSIFVVVDGKTKNLKYDFADVMYQLKELHISTKYVF